MIEKYQFTYGVRGARHDQGSVWYLGKYLEDINLPKVCGSRIQAWPSFYLILRKMIKTYQFKQGMWSKDPGMTKPLFET